jgi:PHS family inorganic phosphate transporter-like MFS transporter
MTIAFISTVLSSFASVGSPTSVYAVIILFRFTLGIGLGGVFPLSATKASEDAAQTPGTGKVNSKASSWSFFWQLPGLILPWLLGYCFSYSSLTTSQRWRLIMGLGAIPSLLTIAALYIEATMQPTTPAIETSPPIVVDTRENSRTESLNVTLLPAGGAGHHVPLSTVLQLLKEPAIRRKLLAAGGSWFLYDVVVYGLGQLSGYTIDAISTGDDNVSANNSIQNVCSKQLIVMSLTIPTTILSIYLVSLLGLRWLQIISFLLIAFLLLLLAALFDTLDATNSNALFALYALAFAAMNFGVGITTFSLPAALFPKEIRSTFNGISAAMGKVGAVISTFSFYYIAEDAGYPALIALCCIVALFGALLSYFFILPEELLSEEKGVEFQNSVARSQFSHSSSFTSHGSSGPKHSSYKLDSADFTNSVSSVHMVKVESLVTSILHEREESEVDDSGSNKSAVGSANKSGAASHSSRGSLFGSTTSPPGRKSLASV